MYFWENPVGSLRANQIIRHGVRYFFSKQHRNVWSVTREFPTPYGVRGYGTGGRHSEKLGTMKYTKKLGWHSDYRTTYLDEALALVNAKLPNGPGYGESFIVIDVP